MQRDDVMKKEVETPIAALPAVKKRYTKRAFYIAIGALAAIAGIGLFAIYFFTMNMVFGGMGVVLFFSGGFTFYYFWNKDDSTGFVIESLGAPPKEQVNSLCIYEHVVKFDNIANPEGWPSTCHNDNKKYYVYIWDKVTEKLIPFILPDQQYYEPEVFAQRVLALPAHRKLFTRKPKLFQKLKTAMLVLAIAIVMLLILTTTGGS
jgi:hypothetical protein